MTQEKKEYRDTNNIMEVFKQANNMSLGHLLNVTIGQVIGPVCREVTKVVHKKVKTKQTPKRLEPLTREKQQQFEERYTRLKKELAIEDGTTEEQWEKQHLERKLYSALRRDNLRKPEDRIDMDPICNDAHKLTDVQFQAAIYLYTVAICYKKRMSENAITPYSINTVLENIDVYWDYIEIEQIFEVIKATLLALKQKPQEQSILKAIMKQMGFNVPEYCQQELQEMWKQGPEQAQEYMKSSGIYSNEQQVFQTFLHYCKEEIEEATLEKIEEMMSDYKRNKVLCNVLLRYIKNTEETEYEEKMHQAIEQTSKELIHQTEELKALKIIAAKLGVEQSLNKQLLEAARKMLEEAEGKTDKNERRKKVKDLAKAAGTLFVDEFAIEFLKIDLKGQTEDEQTILQLEKMLEKNHGNQELAVQCIRHIIKGKTKEGKRVMLQDVKQLLQPLVQV
jgi:hypothetical protein